MSEEKEVLSEEDCQIVIAKYREETNSQYICHELKRITSIEGFAGAHYKVKIYHQDTSGFMSDRFFLKVLTTVAKVLYDMCLSLNAYEKEELFYAILIKEFNRVGLDISYAPQYYHYRPYLILLEDLTLRGYKNTPKKDMLDVEHCKVGLKTLAHFHASAIAYEEIKSKQQQSPFRIFDLHSELLGEKVFSKTKNAASVWFDCTLQGLLHIIDLLPEDKISPEEFKARLLVELETCYELSKPSDKYRNTLLHGDLWTNNFMFRYEDGKPVDSVLIDYQLLKYGVPAVDVVQMIVTNVRRNLRLRHYDELLDSYYDSFSEYLQTYGIDASDVLCKVDFLKSCEEIRLISKLHAAADHSITFLVDEVVGEAFTSEEALTKFLFEDRTDCITASYQNCDLFRDVLQEDLIGIRDLLFSKKTYISNN